MSKRKAQFLITVAAALSSLIAPHSSAKQSQVGRAKEHHSSQIQKATPAYQKIYEDVAQSILILKKEIRQSYSVGHRSHMSHRSHASHRSHYSSR
jgi:hypothetical protein